MPIRYHILLHSRSIAIVRARGDQLLEHVMGYGGQDQGQSVDGNDQYIIK